MSNTNKLFTTLDEFKNLLTMEVNILTSTIQQSNNSIEQQKKEINELKKSNQDKDDELATYKKSSIMTQLNKQLLEYKNQISVLEQQLHYYKTNTNTFSKSETTITELNNEIKTRDNYIEVLEGKLKKGDEQTTKKFKKEEIIVEDVEYETVTFKKKTYYLVGKKVYIINKDKSLGDFFGRYKNGEVVKKQDD